MASHLSMIHSTFLAILCTCFLISCTGKNTSATPTTPTKDSLAKVVESFGYEVVDTDQGQGKLEKLDRSFYKPLSVECGRIRSLKSLAGYHGPTLGNYYLSIEEYRTPEEASKRAAEYRDFSRLVSATGEDKHYLGKRTVRCWGYSSAERAYLLTTHAFMFSALENKVHSVIDGVKAYEKTKGRIIKGISETEVRSLQVCPWCPLEKDWSAVRDTHDGIPLGCGGFLKR